MATKSSTKRGKHRNVAVKAAAEIDLDPDAWPKFEKLIRDAAKAGPKRQVGSKTSK